MDPDARLFQGVIRQQGEDVIQRMVFLLAQIQAEQLAQKPLAEQLHFPVQQRRIVGRQQRRAGIAADLQARQRLQSVAVQAGDAAFIEFGQILPGTEIGQQQQTLIQIASQHFGRIQPQPAQRLGDSDKRPAIFLVRRGIHDDASLAIEPDPEIAAETGVAGSRGDPVQRRGHHVIQPVPQQLLAFTHEIHSIRSRSSHAMANAARLDCSKNQSMRC